MDQFLGFMQNYGSWSYPLLFAYCAIKSGTLPLFAGIVSAAGGLHAGGVFAAVFAGGYLGDELRFWVSRRYGPPMVERPGRLQTLYQRAAPLLDRYGAAYVFLYRYPKGMRTIGALPLGMTSMPWSRFTLLNFASALVWTTALVGLGYGMGEAIAGLAETHFAAVAIGLLAVFAVLSLLAWRLSPAIGKAV